MAAIQLENIEVSGIVRVFACYLDGPPLELLGEPSCIQNGSTVDYGVMENGQR